MPAAATAAEAKDPQSSGNSLSGEPDMHSPWSPQEKVDPMRQAT